MRTEALISLDLSFVFRLLPAICAVLLFGSGCASDTSYDRHSLSHLWVSDNGKQLYFDATVTSAYPTDSRAAEDVRRGWVADWLKLRGYCPDGHTVGAPRPIRPDEYNPRRHSLRYEVECL